jgi:hypothetical protein
VRYVAIAGFALLISGCAEGEKKDETLVDTGVADVAVLEIGGDDSTADSGSAEESSVDGTTSDAVDDTATSDTEAGDSGAGDSGSGDSASADTGTTADTATDAAETGAAWTHTIAIDGTNDFAAGETFVTTSGTYYTAYVTWDATYVYWAMQGADIGTTTSPNKWLFLYIDTDPTASTGATSGVKYNTEQPVFPTGFGAEYYARWKTDDSYQTLEHYAASAWSTVATVVEHHRTGNYVEFRVKRSDLGSPSKVGLSLFMMNETSTAEAAYAGLEGSFADGYHATLNIAKYLYVDFAATTPPTDPSRIKP